MLMTRRHPVLLVLIACVTASQAILAQPAPPRVRVAQIISAQGAVEVRRGPAEPWTLARTGQELVGSDGLRTGAFAVAKLKFEAGVQWSMAATSELLLGDAVAGGTSSILVRLLHGGVVARWNPDRGPAAQTATRVVVATASGQATITGTEWSIHVDDDGRTAVAVQDGAVELSNEHGGITVRANESAEMRVGQAPVPRLLSPRDRVQWVAEYSGQPARFAALESGAARAALDLAVADTASGDTAAAIERLERYAAEAAAPAGIVLALTDLLIAAGNLEGARQRAEAGRERFVTDARFDALLSRIALFEDRVADSRALAESATVKDPKSVEAWLALGEWARRDGDAAVASRAFRQATIVNPGDARGWFGQGSVETEREIFVAARRSLTEALRLDPAGPGFRGEMGTLETLANRLNPAEREYAQALAARPEDYVALTGRALLALKQGREAEALELLLKAGLMEPRYARAQLYLGVTYYRLRRHDDAIRALRRASELDAKDPLPHLMQSAIYTDQFEPSKAMMAGRKALELMPYLKSLNQLANTQEGTANLGNSVAFFGMEQWAQHLAQESYSPFWAGSHLFLGDRYADSYSRTSEYYQGLLADPTAFGGSPRFQTLLPRSGHYGTAGVSTGQDEAQMWRSDATVSANGYVNRRIPIAYAVSAQDSRLSGAGNELTEQGSLATQTPRTISAAIGAAPSPRWGLFATVAHERERDRFRVDFDDGNPFDASWLQAGARFDAGVNFRPSPRSTVAMRTSISAATADVPIAKVLPQFAFSSRPFELQSHYTTLLAERHELSAGFEVAIDRQKILYDYDFGEGAAAAGILRSASSEGQGFLSARSRWGAAIVQADLFLNRERITVTDTDRSDPTYNTTYVSTQLQPRFGTAIRVGSGVLRGSFQRRTRPSATSTLGPVATAGIPLDDSLVQPLGLQRRGRLQIDWEWSSQLFTTAFADYQKVDNVGDNIGLEATIELVQKWFEQQGDGATPDLAEALIALRDIGRDASRLNVGSQTLAEGDSDVSTGRAVTMGIGVNRVLTPQLSIATQYEYADSSGPTFFVDDDHPEGGVRTQQLSYLPAHVFSVGTTWVSPRRLYISGKAIHRSHRFEASYESKGRQFVRREQDADWTARFAGTWETRNKRWAIEFAAADLLAKSRSASYSLTAKLRR